MSDKHAKTKSYGFHLLIIASNIWGPLANVSIVKAIAAKYKFSTRLQGTIIGWDEARRQVAQKLPKKSKQKVSRPENLGDPILGPRKRRTFHHRSNDPEKGSPDEGEATKEVEIARSLGLDKLHEEDLHMYKLLQEQYNYTTIDHGSNCKSESLQPPLHPS